jgi:hypothetical protein
MKCWMHSAARTRAGANWAIICTRPTRSIRGGAQTINIGYEAAHGLKEKDGRAKGYTICATKSIKATPDACYARFASATSLDAWLGAGHALDFKDGGSLVNADGNRAAIRKLSPGKTIKLVWQQVGAAPDTPVEVKFQPSGAKTTVMVTHERLQTREEAGRTAARLGRSPGASESADRIGMRAARRLLTGGGMDAPHARSLPPPSLATLNPPIRGYRYFAAAAHWPFVSGQGIDSLRNTWWMAEHALLAYAEPGVVLAALEAHDYRVQVFQDPASSGHAYVAVTADHAVLAFRGTETVNPGDAPGKIIEVARDWRVDARFGQVPLAEVGARTWRLRLGTRRTVGRRSNLAWRLRRAGGARGHSLGGALAALAALRLHRAGHALAGAITFGQPRCGDRVLAQALDAFAAATRGEWLRSGAALAAITSGIQARRPAPASGRATLA